MNGLTGNRAALTLGIVLAAIVAAGCERAKPAAEGKSSVRGALTDAGTSGYFARAVAPRPFHFPGDHGPHPDFKQEWWYFTGNLATSDGRPFGYQLTFFRVALPPPARPVKSGWATAQFYMAHFTVTDISAGTFHPFERFARGTLGLAGAHADPLRVWVESWSLRGGKSSTFPLLLTASEDNLAIDLALEPIKPVVLQGEQGLSRKSAAVGNASYYYSIPRLATRGSIRVGAETYTVTGLSWLDREWGTSVLGRDQAGWDWFALQLTDGRDLMYYRLRRLDGSADPFSGGSLTEADGSVRSLSAEEVEMEITARWQSPATGITYPARWRLRVPKEGLDLAVSPRLPGQELSGAFIYWEGAVTVGGTSQGIATNGNGYVELAGYGDQQP